MSDKKPTYKELEDEISKLKLQSSIQKEKRISKSTLTEVIESPLLEHGEKFGLLFKHMPSAFVYAKVIFEKDKVIDFEFIEINSAFTKLTGHLNVDGLNMSEVVPEGQELDPKMLEVAGRVVKTGIPEHLDFYAKSLGTWLSAQIFSPKKNYVIAVSHDITARKLEEEELIKRKEKAEKDESTLNSIVSTIGDPLFVKDDQSRFVFVNDAFCKLFDLTRIHIIGKTLAEHILPDEQDLFLKIDRQVIRNGEENINEESLTIRNGQTRIISTRKTRFINSEGKRFLVGIIHDITERCKAEQALKAAKLRLEKIKNKLAEAQKLANIGSWTRNILTQKSEWTDETFHIWGFDSKKETPNYDEVLKRVHADDVKLFKSAFSKVTQLRLLQDIEFRICLPNGDKKVIRGLYDTVLVENDEVISIAGTSQDITKQKLFEKNLIKLERLEAIGEMSSSIAHDFNNSLQGMMGNLEIAKLQDDLSETTRDRLNSIESTITDVVSRVNALQHFGDPQREAKNAELINLNTLITESLKQSRPLWKDSQEKEGLKIRVTTEFGDIPKINCNLGELKTALHNLIKNSIEAMPKGGDLNFKTKLKPEGVSVIITDTGIGMDEETKLKVFQPFYSTKGFTSGRGLGMSGVYSIVKKHKGDVFVKYSELGKGTTIEIVFPIGQPEAIKDIPENKPVPKDKEPFRVLWVDDDTTIRENASELLELIGHTCDHVDSGKSALDYLNKNTRDIVFTDIGMPEMNGWQLADTIRSTFGNNIKIVVVTGWDIDEQTKKEHHVDFVLQKPFTMEAIEKIIRAV